MRGGAKLSQKSLRPNFARWFPHYVLLLVVNPAKKTSFFAWLRSASGLTPALRSAIIRQVRCSYSLQKMGKVPKGQNLFLGVFLLLVRFCCWSSRSRRLWAARFSRALSLLSVFSFPAFCLALVGVLPWLAVLAPLWLCGAVLSRACFVRFPAPLRLSFACGAWRCCPAPRALSGRFAVVRPAVVCRRSGVLLFCWVWVAHAT